MCYPYELLGPPDQAQQQGNDSQYDQYMDQSTSTVNKESKEPPYHKYNGDKI